MTRTSRSVRPTAFVAAAASSLLFVMPAFAQESSGEEDEAERGWTVTLGAGLQVSPEYPGADSLRLYPVPSIGLRRQGDPLSFEAPDEGWGFGFLGEDGMFDFGPAVQFEAKRREEDVGAPVGEVDTTFELGGFAQLSFGDHFRLRGEGRKGLGGHDGWVGDLMADLVIRDRDTYIFSIGPRARWADDTYHDAYFSVTPAVAAATGLAVFDADGGFHAVGVAAGLTYKLDRHWGLYGWAGYDRLIGDAADSPIVRAFGSRDQFSAGAAIIYEFDIADPFD